MGIVILIVLSSLNYYKIFAIKPGNIGKPVVLMHHLDFSMFLAWTAVFGLALILFRKKEYVENLNMTWIDWGTWGSATLLSLGWIFVQTGRSGQLALVVGLIALIVLFVNNRVEGWVKKTGMVAAAIVLLAGTVKLQYEFSRNFKERIDIGVNDINLILKKNNYSSSLGIRVFAIKTGISIVKDYPITGVGIGDNMDVFKDYVARIKGKKPDKFFLNSIQKNHFHNQYIQILTETGLVGFVLFLSIIIFLFLKTEKIYSIMFILFFFSGFIAEPFLRNQFISVLFCFFMVIFSASREVDLKDQEIK
jgi:O-antigen ligase